jgi:hypothetical protein
VEFCLGLVLSETSSYYTYFILPQHLTNKQLFSSHQTTSHQTHSEKFPLHLWQCVRSNCWMFDHWMLGGSVACVTPLLLPSRRTPVKISCLWTGTQLSYALIGYCLLKNDYSHGWNKRYFSEMPYHFSCFKALTIYRPVSIFLEVWRWPLTPF